MTFGRFLFCVLVIGSAIIVIVPPVEANAKQCDAKVRAEILAPVSEDKRIVKLRCSIKLSKRDVVTKRIFLQGAKASGVVFNCDGATLNAGLNKFGNGKDVIVIRSKKGKDGRWSRPENIKIKNCKINGSLRIYGLGVNGESETLKASSVSLGHTKRAQQAAPTKIVLHNLVITGQGRIPLYISPGVTRVTVKNSIFKGTSLSVAIYLDAESAHNRIVNNRFNVATSKRELVAIDGSAHNVIKRNIFSGLQNGGIYLYRNCGEGGTVRHQAPQFNEITNNGFFYRRFSGYKTSIVSFGEKQYFPAIWIGSRNGNRNYCGYDKGHNFGSSKNDGDLAQNNTVSDNQIVKLSPTKMIRSFGSGNKMSGNRTVQKIQLIKK